MILYEVLFILLFLGSAVAVGGLLIVFATRRKAAASKTLLGVVTVWCVYFALLVTSDLNAKPLVVAPGQDRCFDEMCFAVVSARTTASTNYRDRELYFVTVRVTSNSLGRTQSEGGIRARLYERGQYFEVSPQLQNDYEREHGKGPVLTQRLSPGEAVQSVVVFDVPHSVEHPGLTLDHGFTPGYFVFGESPFFHGPDIFALP